MRRADFIGMFDNKVSFFQIVQNFSNRLGLAAFVAAAFGGAGGAAFGLLADLDHGTAQQVADLADAVLRARGDAH